MATIKERGILSWASVVQSGVSQQTGNGWARQTLVIDVEGYNGSFRKVAVQAGTQQIQSMRDFHIAVGDKVEITYQVTAREYQGKWYNNVDLFKIESLTSGTAANVPTPQPMVQPVPQPMYQQPVQQPMVQPQPAPQRAMSAYEVCDKFCRQVNCDYNLGTHGEACQRAIMAGQYTPGQDGDLPI